MEITEETLVTHLDVKAPAGLWHRLGYEIIPRNEGALTSPKVQTPKLAGDLDILVIAGKVNFQQRPSINPFMEDTLAGTHILIWAITEQQRRREVERQVRASEQLAEAVGDLRHELIYLGQTIRNK